ncbi:MAG: AMP-binding protein [Kordiimonadaceae bacterium]|nr:AMP-binding protein [Kordiimonadaceae bacterium]
MTNLQKVTDIGAWPEPFMHRICKMASLFPDSVALLVGKETVTYHQLLSRSLDLAAKIKDDASEYCILYIDNSAYRFIAILAAILAGKTYVPVATQRATALRTKHMLCQVDMANACFITMSENETGLALVNQFIPKGALVIGREALLKPPAAKQPSLEDMVQKIQNPNVCLLFTSGSTGAPKGVLLTHKNINCFVENTIETFGVSKEDIFGHVASYAFDCHIHDFIVPLCAGASVQVIGALEQKRLLLMMRYYEITHSVIGPSFLTSIMADGFNIPNFLPKFKRGLIGGEPVTQEICRWWSKIAPKSDIYNVYGPTEATVIFTYHRWSPRGKQKRVPIGKPFEGLKVSVLDKKGNEVAIGEEGELCLAGGQVAAGYLNDEKNTQKAFFNSAGEHWYRSGDFVEKQAGGELVFVGRRDDCLKVSGIRVNKFELEEEIRAATGLVSLAVAPVGGSNFCQHYALFLTPGQQQKSMIIEKCKAHMPQRMCPAHVFVETLPINQNGKVDYAALDLRLTEKLE